MFGKFPPNDSNLSYEDSDNPSYHYVTSEHKATPQYWSENGTMQKTSSGPIFGDNPGYDTNFGMDPTVQFGGGFLTSQATPSTTNQTNIGNHTFLQLKISMINRAWKDNVMDTQFSILGLPIEHIKLVGHVLSIQQQGDNKYIIMIDDGTGLITCEYIVADSPSPYRVNQLKEILDKPDIYVKVYGAINMLGKKVPHIRAHIIRSIQNPNEIALHDLEVCYLASKRLSFVKEMQDFSLQPQSDTQSYGNTLETSKYFNPSITFSGNSPTRNSHPNFQNQYDNQNLGYMQPSEPSFNYLDSNNKSLKTIVSTILTENAAINQKGLHINEIKRRCQMDYNQPKISEHAVRNALQELENEALVYNTINPDTYHSTRN